MLIICIHVEKFLAWAPSLNVVECMIDSRDTGIVFVDVRLLQVGVDHFEERLMVIFVRIRVPDRSVCAEVASLIERHSPVQSDRRNLDLSQRA